MFDTKKINETLMAAKKEKWPYPRTFEALKKLDVESYEVLFENYTSTYKSALGQTWSEPPPEGFTPLSPHGVCNSVQAKKALLRHQQGETTFVTFLSDMAEAGIIGYHVSMAARTVTYFGKDPKDCFEEQVPYII